MHIGRSWGGGGYLEAACPCPLEPCGLVDVGKVSTECDQHPPIAGKSMRSGHPAEDCPGVGRDVVVAIGKTEAARQAVIEAAAMEPEGFVNASILGALDDYRAAVEHEAAERIRLCNHEHYEVAGPMFATEAANHIDPEVTHA
jgi:hypothetical protein